MNDISKGPFIYYLCTFFLNNQPTLVIIFSVIEIAIFWITYLLTPLCLRNIWMAPKAPEDKDTIVKNDDKTDQKDSNSIAQINDKG